MTVTVLGIIAAFYAGFACGVLICAHCNAAKEADEQADSIERRL